MVENTRSVVGLGLQLTHCNPFSDRTERACGRSSNKLDPSPYRNPRLVLAPNLDRPSKLVFSCRSCFRYWRDELFVTSRWLNHSIAHILLSASFTTFTCLGHRQQFAWSAFIGVGGVLFKEHEGVHIITYSLVSGDIPKKGRWDSFDCWA